MDVHFTNEQAMQIYYGGLIWLWFVPIFVPSVLAFLLTLWVRPKFIFLFLLPTIYAISLIWFIPDLFTPDSRDLLSILRAPGYMIPIVLTIGLTYIVAISTGQFRAKKKN